MTFTTIAHTMSALNKSFGWEREGRERDNGRLGKEARKRRGKQ